MAELTKVPSNDLEIISWQEPKECGKAREYAEKLVVHEVLAEMIAS